MFALFVEFRKPRDVRCQLPIDCFSIPSERYRPNTARDFKLMIHKQAAMLSNMNLLMSAFEKLCEIVQVRRCWWS
jgi:hypothetical protein